MSTSAPKVVLSGGLVARSAALREKRGWVGHSQIRRGHSRAPLQSFDPPRRYLHQRSPATRTHHDLWTRSTSLFASAIAALVDAPSSLRLLSRHCLGAVIVAARSSATHALSSTVTATYGHLAGANFGRFQVGAPTSATNELPLSLMTILLLLRTRALLTSRGKV